MFDQYFSPCKCIRTLESGKFLLVESKIREHFARGIRNPGLWNPEQSSSTPKSHEGMESRTHVPLKKTGIQHPESTIHGMGSRIQDCLLFLNIGRQYQTANGESLFQGPRSSFQSAVADPPLLKFGGGGGCGVVDFKKWFTWCRLHFFKYSYNSSIIFLNSLTNEKGVSNKKV